MSTPLFSIHAVSPAILPSLLGQDLVGQKNFVSQKIGLLFGDKTSVTVGTLGEMPVEFNLYTDALDAGADFRKYFAMRIEFPCEFEMSKYVSDSGITIQQKGNLAISVYNDAIAVVSVNFDLDLENTLSLPITDRAEFDKFFVETVNFHVQKWLVKLDGGLKEIFGATRVRRSKVKNYLASEITTPKIGWVHKVFEIDTEYATALKSDCRFGKLIAEHVLTSFDGIKSEFSWGDSVHIANTYPTKIVMTAIELMQYHYFILDRFNRRLPYAISQVATSGNEMSERIKQGLGMKMRHKLVMQDLTYEDLLQSVAGTLRIPIMEYHASWRFDDLRESLQLKLPILQGLIADIQSKHQARSNSIVELMLFGVSLLSLVGLFISTHDYVIKSPKDKTSTTQVLQAMLPNRLEDVLSFAILLAILGISVLALVRFRLLKKVMSLFA